MYEVIDQFDNVEFTGSKEACIAYLKSEDFSFTKEFKDGVSQYTKVGEPMPITVIRYLNKV